MTRIFLTLAVFSTLALLVAFWLGWTIGDASAPEAAELARVTVHFLTAVAAIVFALLVHAIVLTYFMGTGRWLEETCAAYRIDIARQEESRNLKWRLYPAMTVSLTLLVATGALGGAADPASAVGFRGIGPLTAAEVHMAVAAATLAINTAVNCWEYIALRRNGIWVAEVLAEVRRIRLERGLDV